MNTLLENPFLLTLLRGASTLFLFAAALGISSAIRLNKGAKSNRSMMLIAVGLILFALAEGNQFLDRMGLSILEGWDDIKMAAGALLVLLGVLHWRGLLKSVIK